jgi:uncharacterized protein (TIGR03000 family)
MYTIVLAAFLTTGNEVPDFGRRGGCHGCRGGCYGGWGGCYGGCSGWGGCSGGGWGGCYGGCGGCYGGGGCFGCGGGGGCFGGGGGCFGCGGCGGIVVSGGCTGMASGGGGSAPGAGGGGGSGAQAGGGGGSGAQAGGSTEVTQALQELKTSIETLKKEQNKLRIEALTQTAAELKLKATEQKIDELRRAIEELKRRLPPRIMPPAVPRPELPPPQEGKGQVLMEMPADALVFVNDKRIDAATAFLTPELQPDQEYAVKVETVSVHGGKNINRVKRLSIHAGEVVRLAYQDMEPAEQRWTSTGQKAAAPAHITVRLPADARLNVHGVDCPLTSETRTFDTPVLTPGETYSYLLKAEVLRDGRTVAQTQRVTFRSGQRVLVSFEDLGTRSLSAR